MLNGPIVIEADQGKQGSDYTNLAAFMRTHWKLVAYRITQPCRYLPVGSVAFLYLVVCTTKVDGAFSRYIR